MARVRWVAKKGDEWQVGRWMVMQVDERQGDRSLRVRWVAKRWEMDEGYEMKGDGWLQEGDERFSCQSA